MNNDLEAVDSSALTGLTKLSLDALHAVEGGDYWYEESYHHSILPGWLEGFFRDIQDLFPSPAPTPPEYPGGGIRG